MPLSPITAQDILNQMSDYLGNYQASSVDPGQKLRAVNRAIEYIKRRFGLPCDEGIYNFLYSEDQMFYDLPDDFDESLQLYYATLGENYSTRPWEYRVYSEILEKSGDWSNQRLYSVTSVNGKKQLVMKGPNLYGGFILDPLSYIGQWTVSGDGSNLVVDPDNYPPNGEGSGQSSLSCTVTKNTGVVSFNNAVVNWNIQSLLSRPGYIKLYTQLSSADISSISIILTTSTGNYYTCTATVDDSGDDFVAGSWIEIGWNFSDVVITGSPNPASITSVQINFTLSSSYTTGTIWINDLYEMFEDSMNLIYMSQYKGTDTTGNTKKVILDEPSDVVTIGNEYPDFIDMIAMRAAINAYPTVLGDPNFYSAYNAQWQDLLRTFGRVFPRKRTQNSSYQTEIRRY